MWPFGSYIERPQDPMARREFLTRLSQIVPLPFLAAGVLQAQAQLSKKSLKIMMKSAWGSDDPTKAAFPFSHGLARSEAGHDVQMFLLGEAVSLMRKAVADSVTPVGWPPVVEPLTKLAARKVPIYACGACSRARGVTEEDLANFGAK
jgi:predicted peroxiredoxin